MTGKTQKSAETVGWILFTLSALLFTLSSFGNGDAAGLPGSLLFLIACGFFVGPQAVRAFGKRLPNQTERAPAKGE